MINGNQLNIGNKSITIARKFRDDFFCKNNIGYIVISIAYSLFLIRI